MSSVFLPEKIREIEERLDFEELVEHFDDEPPCAEKTCSRPGRWAVRCGVCRALLVACTPHRLKHWAWMHLGISGETRVHTCGGCRSFLPSPLPWRPL